MKCKKKKKNPWFIIWFMCLKHCVRQTAESPQSNESIICIISAFLSVIWLLGQTGMDLMDAELIFSDMTGFCIVHQTFE